MFHAKKSSENKRQLYAIRTTDARQRNVELYCTERTLEESVYLFDGMSIKTKSRYRIGEIE